MYQKGSKKSHRATAQYAKQFAAGLLDQAKVKT